MMLYHGSSVAVEKPDLSFSRLRTDFGKGFYLTPLKEQAERWAERFLRERTRERGAAAVVSSFEFSSNSGSGLASKIKTLEFGAHDAKWLDFITSCRLGTAVDSGWDLIIGGGANDKVFDTLQLYFDKLIGAAEAIGRLQYSKPNLQYCFKTQSVINACLRFAGSEALR
jgi:hypothetical protein